MSVGTLLGEGGQTDGAARAFIADAPCSGGAVGAVNEPPFWQTLVLLGATSSSLALATWMSFARIDLVAYVRDHRIEPSTDVGVSPGLIAGISAGVVAFLTAVAFVALPRRRAVLAFGARRLSPLVLAAFLPALFSWQLWSGRELAHLLYASVIVLSTKKLVAFALSAPVSGESEGGQRLASSGVLARCRDGIAQMTRAIPASLGFGLVLAGVVWYSAFFSYYTIVHHRNVLSASFDLGLEENIIYNIAHFAKPIFKSSPLGGPNASHLGSHATWFAYLIAPIYAIWPKTETLLVFQAVLMGGAAIPLYLLARRFLSVGLSVFVAYLYLLYPGLHGANLYDFHYLPLGPFFLWFVLYFLEKGHWVRAAIFALITLSIREDIAVSLGFLGGLWLLAGRRSIPALALLLLGGAYFVVMKGVVMHRAFGGDAFVHQYKLLIPDGEHGFSGVVKTILSNPVYTLQTLLERQKLVYFLQIMLPLSFFPLRRYIGLWAAVPGLLFALFSTEYPPLLMISFQYTTYWTAQLFPVLLLNLRWMDGRVREGTATKAWRTSWLAAIFVGCLAVTHQYGALLQHNTTIGGFGRYHFGSDDSDFKRRRDLGKIIAMVPPKAKVVATENVVPQLANRPDAYTLRIGIFDADYIIFRLPTSGDERRNVVRVLDDGQFGIVIESGEFVLAKRGASTEQNESFIDRMGGRHHVDD
jgi:uncharacterized membrane protein